MACGMIVAPRIEAASSTEVEPSKRGTRPAATPAGSGGAISSPNEKPTAMITSIPMSTVSKARAPRRVWMSSRPIDTTPVIVPPHTRGTPKSRCSATAPPMTSATSVAIATASAWSQ